MTKPESSLNPDLVNFSAGELRKQLDSMPIIDTWQFGPFKLMARQSNNLIVVDWEPISNEPISSGEFNHLGKRWVYSEVNRPSGLFSQGKAVKEMSLTHINPRADHPTGYVNWCLYSYSIDQNNHFSFYARVPDDMGGEVNLNSKFQADESSSLLISKHWPNTIYFQASHLDQGKDSLPVLSGILPDRVARLLSAQHLLSASAAEQKPDILEILSLEDLQPVVDLNRSSGQNPVGQLSGNLKRSAEKAHIQLLPQRYLRNPRVNSTLDLTPTPLPKRTRIAVALVELIHHQPNWLTSGDSLNLEDLQVMVGRRAAAKTMAGTLVVVSGKILNTERVLGLKGAVQGGIREIGEERVVFSTGPISYSPTIIAGAYLDPVADSNDPFLVITCTRIVADPARSINFSWTEQGKTEFDDQPHLVTLSDLQEKIVQDKFHPGVLAALSQSLRVVSRLSVNKAKALAIDHLDEKNLRQFSLEFA